MDDSNEIAREVAQMADYWGERRDSWRDEAADEFERIVMPACLREPDPDFRQIQMVNMCFTEWVLFERPLRGGDTPLRRFIDSGPLEMTDPMSGRLMQIAETQFFSRFAILDKDPTGGRAVLRDVRTDRDYEVFDEILSSNPRWRNGTIAERIARVDGSWHAVGQVHLYDRVIPDETRTDGPGEIHPGDPRAEEMRKAGFFLRLVRDVLGFDGRYAPTLSVISLERAGGTRDM